MFKHNCSLVRKCQRVIVNPLREMYSQQQHWFKPEGIDTGIRIYNCAARRKVPLIMSHENFLTWYTCGPTVYDFPHLGHASCYVKLDIIQRILRQYFNLNVVTAMNITDIDDKIIQKSIESGKDWREISRFYEAEFWSDLKKLNVLEPNIKVRVTDHIPKIINFISDIVEKKNAYIGKDLSVYFNVNQFPIYGKLQNLNLSEDNGLHSVNKLSQLDFALWKSSKSKSEPCWASPWSDGRPGWHIECSAMGNMVFGKSIDIHAGGMDLKFPHHENEEAQSCVYHSTRQWVNYWLHTGHLSIKGEKEKMSKSLKNTITIDEMLKDFTADEFRMACVLSNYKNSMDYSHELMNTAKNTLSKFKTFNVDCLAYLNGKKINSNLNVNTLLQNLKYAKSSIEACIKDDFDTSRSISVLLDQIAGTSRCINSDAVNISGNETSSCLDAVAAVNNYVQFILQSFGFTFAELNKKKEIKDTETLSLDVVLEGILKARQNIRTEAVSKKNKALFQICDDIRNSLREHGIEIRDHSQGSTWNFIENK